MAGIEVLRTVVIRIYVVMVLERERVCKEVVLMRVLQVILLMVTEVPVLR